jgi:BirA family transcriptional regulator, biotin operon repressor / biotin---[acetyl-CoA-carboxylase] ligase
VGDAGATVLGHPRVHLRRTDSTNERARKLAIEGAPHGTLVSAAEQTAGRGRQGRTWVAPAGSALLCSLVLRDPPPLLSLIAGVAVCDAVGPRACVKWPNDVVFERFGRDTQPSLDGAPTLTKLAGILVEGRPQDGWAVLGIGLNVAVRLEQLPRDVGERAASLELPSNTIEALLERLMEALEHRLSEPLEEVLGAWRARDALRGRDVSWGAPDLDRPARHGERQIERGKRRIGHGRATGIDEAGRLIVTLGDGSIMKLDSGEIHLGPAV